MNTTTTTRLLFACVLLSLGFWTSASHKPAYYPYGPQTNVPIDQLVGWKRCWMTLYNTTDDGVEQVFNNCPGAHLLYGCRNGTDSFTVLAVGNRTMMLNDTGDEDNNSDVLSIDNGVGFYFSNRSAIGFVKENDTVWKNSCDVESDNGELRLCWHASIEEEGAVPTFDGGYRCGVTEDLNDNDQWVREIWRPVDPCEDKNEGDTCDDFDTCTIDTTCQSGVCKGKPLCGCLECDQVTGCTTTQLSNGTSCDDDNLCTEVDTCQSGVCVGSSPVICQSEQACYNSTCIPATGKCQSSVIDGCTDGTQPTTSGGNTLFIGVMFAVMISIWMASC